MGRVSEGWVARRSGPSGAKARFVAGVEMDGLKPVPFMERVEDCVSAASVRSLKTVQRTRRCQREVSLAPQGVLPPRDS